MPNKYRCALCRDNRGVRCFAPAEFLWRRENDGELMRCKDCAATVPPRADAAPAALTSEEALGEASRLQLSLPRSEVGAGGFEGVQATASGNRFNAVVLARA
jgi:hypothetical protein